MNSPISMTCPCCGASKNSIFYDGMKESFFEGLSTVCVRWNGTCKTCGSHLEWRENYELVSITSMKVREEEAFK